MSPVVEGRAPDSLDKEREAYLSKKLDDARKDCQWLLGLGAASVLGVVIKDNFGAFSPRLRTVTLIISALQILLSMLGAMSWWSKPVDPAEFGTKLEQRLRSRFRLRNLAIMLLAVSFILIALLGWYSPTTTKL